MNISAPDFGALNAAFARRDRKAINALLLAWLAGDAPVGDRWHIFSQILAQHGEIGAAITAMRRAISAAPNGDRPVKLAELLAAQGRGDDALGLLSTIGDASAPRAMRQHFTGALLSERGDFVAAERAFGAALAAWPGSGSSWLELAAIHRFDANDPLLAKLRAAEPSFRGAPAAQAGPYRYALGKALDDVGDTGAAFAAFAAGAAAIAPERPFDPVADTRYCDSVIATFDRATIDRMAAKQTLLTTRPIFVMGLPRSGTTLVEQILASHSAVAGGGEINRVEIVADDMGGPRLNDMTSYLGGAGTLEDLAALYLHLLDERFGSTGRVIDKTLNASRLLGVIASVFPAAPLIWLRRDPLDTAWSCFRTYFAEGVPWSWRLDQIATYFRNDDRLFAHWHKVLGDRLLVVPYEALVADPAAWTARLLDHCGLPPEAATLAPHRTERRVLTSSVAQVRQPITTRAIGAADRYRAHLQPFIDAYGYTG